MSDIKTIMPGMVSVVIPTYRRAAALKEAIASALAQGSVVLEILVIDDNEDASESGKVLEAVRETGHPETVKYLRNARTKGAPGARNTGIFLAQGEVIAFLDDDDGWLAGKLEAQIEHMRANGCPGVFCGFAWHDHIFNTVVECRPDYKEVTREMLLAGHCPVSTTLAAVDTAILRETGGFDESFPSFQDYDLWMRLVSFGNLGVVPDVLAVFNEHDGDRVSVNIDRRMRGWERFRAKWENDFPPGQLGRLERQYRLTACLANAKSRYSTSYREAVGWSARAVLVAPGAFRPWAWLLLSLAGFRLGRRLRKLWHGD